MDNGVYKFTFLENIPIKEIEECLFWSGFNTESIFGKARFRLDGSFHLDRPRKFVVIDKSTDVGKHLAQIFTSVISREFGEESFRVERLLATEMKSSLDVKTESDK
ncbi:MAG: hypothetical protein KCHDKBKB_01691 [Elusimicrobia bacterium]|nr:hypothetical protein [Elusimicrobiota bacterium]